MGDEKKERPLDTQQLECQHCKNKLPTGSNYCNICGRSLSHEKNQKENEMTLVKSYKEFLEKLNDNQTSFFKRGITVGGVLLLGFLGFLGVGSYVGFKTEIDKSVDKIVKSATAPEKINPLVNEYVNQYCQMHVEKTIEDFDAQIRHEVAYLYIQIARAMAINTSNINTVKKYFQKARKDLIKIVKDNHSYAKSWFELGRLDHYYREKYPRFFDQLESNLTKANTWKEARQHYQKAIENYTEEERRILLAEPSFYVAQLSMRLYFLEENGYNKEKVKDDIEELIKALNNSEVEKHQGFISRAQDILKTVEKDENTWTNDDRKKLTDFSEDISYIKF